MTLHWIFSKILAMLAMVCFFPMVTRAAMWSSAFDFEGDEAAGVEALNFERVLNKADFDRESESRSVEVEADWAWECFSNETSLTPRDLEDLALRLHKGALGQGDKEILPCISEEELDQINFFLEELQLNEAQDASLFRHDPPATDGCETILCHTIQGFSYTLPYTYWYKWEWNGWDLMLEYRTWPASCSTRGMKAFYVNPWSLCDALEPCGIAVYSDRMEANCTRRVTAVIGFSAWSRFGGSYTASHTWLGFGD